MEEPEWTSIFEIKAKNLKQGDSWRLEFDESLVPKRPNWGWKMCVNKTGARFKCTECGRRWHSNRVMVVFHMRLNYRQGVVKVRPLRQNCKNCDEGPMEKASIDSENIGILLDNLVEKIRMKCYHEDLGKKKKHFRRLDVDLDRPHDSSHCEACKHGICTKSYS